jgi:hypothetical protein
MMSKSVFSISILAAAVFIAPAFAVDGTILINQSTVVGSGGFPYHITQSGSYRLSGNLIASNTGAIIISGSSVTLDLNGFAIGCSGTCGSTAISSTAAGTTVMNGNVTGFSGVTAGTGISFTATGGKVDHVNVNGTYTGVTSTTDLIVTNSNVSNNVFGVFVPAGNLTILNSVVSGNLQDGIDVLSGLISGNSISGNGVGGTFLRGGILLWGGSVNITNNIVTNNSVFGIALGPPLNTPNAGYGSNTFGGNVADVAGGSGIVSMHNNVCSGGGC